MGMSHITLPSVDCLALPYFATLSHKGTIFGKKWLLSIKCVLIFSTTSVSKISLSKKEWARYEQKCTLVFTYVKWPLLSFFNETWFFAADFRKKYSNIKSDENLPSGSGVFPCGRTERQTDRHDKANSRFSQFCERSSKLKWHSINYLGPGQHTLAYITPTTYGMPPLQSVPGVLTLRLSRQGVVFHTPAFYAEVKNAWNSTYPHAFMEFARITMPFCLISPFNIILQQHHLFQPLWCNHPNNIK